MSNDTAVNNGQLADLRHELKKWEKSFATANSGRKPGREDITNDATISAKYKEYDRLRRKPTKAQSTPRKGESSRRGKNTLRERPANVISATPKKQVKGSKTLQPTELDNVPDEEPTPACVRCALGPTPQKDGEVLGIFDMMPCGTPSKASMEISTAATEAIVGDTPCKPAASASSDLKLSRTPQSSGKRYYFEAFVGTPLKRKREDDVYTPSTAKRQYATPSFLRRSFPPARIDEDDGDIMATAPPFKKMPMVRSLSTIIQGLRKQEEKRMDDDWEILQEIEAEERGELKQAGVPDMLVEDSQALEMPLGPDQGDASGDDVDVPDAGALDANGKPRKVWKKKGLKRQTRRVIMRPVVNNPGKEAHALPSDSEEGEHDALSETKQQQDRLQRADRDLSDNMERVSEDEAQESDYQNYKQQSRHEATERAERESRKRKKTKSKGGNQGKQASIDSEETGKKPKKVNALAHTNFRKLKIKNKNSKANGRGRKFGRR